MWTYQQTTGQMSHDGEPFAEGYSGNGEHKNNPDSQCIHNHGPIPRGHYTIGQAYQDAHKGPLVMRLTPDADNEMCGRDGFLIHGDSVANPGTASEGCIILSAIARLRIQNSSDKRLEVVQ